jgi:DNA-binding MurR/RpiR family transcriptional regulator
MGGTPFVPPNLFFPLIFSPKRRKIKLLMSFERKIRNMNDQLSQRIQRSRRGFSKSQRAIAKYLQDHPDQVAFMTASRLGATVGVSESTVVRFATEIGYSGYPAMQQAVQEMIRNKLTSVQRLEMTSRNIPPEKLLDAALGQDIDILRRTRENMDEPAFYQAVDALVGAKRVFVLGAGSSLALATFLAHYLRLIFDTVQLIEATSEALILQQMLRAGPGDAIIAISFPRYSKKAAKALKYASSRGMTAIAITDSSLSPLAQGASHLLLARSDMVSFVDSLVGPLSLINALIVTVAIRKKAEVSQSLQTIESIWDEYGVYEKVEEA